MPDVSPSLPDKIAAPWAPSAPDLASDPRFRDCETEHTGIRCPSVPYRLRQWVGQTPPIDDPTGMLPLDIDGDPLWILSNEGVLILQVAEELLPMRGAPGVGLGGVFLAAVVAADGSSFHEGPRSDAQSITNSTTENVMSMQAQPVAASPAPWTPPAPWLETEPGVWTCFLSEHKLVITSTAWCVTWTDQGVPQTGPAPGLAAAALIVCAVARRWTVALRPCGLGWGSDANEWPVWGEDGAGPAGRTSTSSEADMQDLAEALAMASVDLESARFWREQAEAHREAAVRCEGRAGGIASSAIPHLKAAQLCDECRAKRESRATDATSRALALALKMGALAIFPALAKLDARTLEKLEPALVVSVWTEASPDAWEAPASTPVRGEAAPPEPVPVKACHRVGTTLEAQTRACTLPAGHDGYHECHGDRLWGVDGWPADEAGDFRRELNRLEELLADEPADNVIRLPTAPGADDEDFDVALPIETVDHHVLIYLDEHCLARVQRLVDAARVQRLVDACRTAVPGDWQRVGAHAELVLAGDNRQAIEVEDVDGVASVSLHVAVGLDELAACLAAIARAVGR